jgi:hypothetical protein
MSAKLVYPSSSQSISGEVQTRDLELELYQKDHEHEFVERAKENIHKDRKMLEEMRGYNRYEETALSVAKVVSKKNTQYGSSFDKTPEIMKILYPNGIPVDAYHNALTIVRVIDKLSRISNGDQGEESAWSDICGYSILALCRQL